MLQSFILVLIKYFAGGENARSIFKRSFVSPHFSAYQRSGKKTGLF